MKRIALFLCILLCTSTMIARPHRYGKSVSFNKCYEWQESVKSWKKDRYPDYKNIQMYRDDDIYIMQLNKFDKTGKLYILDSKDFERMSKVTPVSKTESFYIDGKSIEEKISKSHIRKWSHNIIDKFPISVEGYKKKFVKMQFGDKHEYMIKYSKYIKLFFEK